MIFILQLCALKYQMKQNTLKIARLKILKIKINQVINYEKNNHINALTIYNISLELYAQEVINKLYDIIPYITIIKINKKCCDHYVLSL